MRFRSVPQEVEAVQWTGENIRELAEFDAPIRTRAALGWELELQAGKDGAQKWVPVPPGHWVVRCVGDKSDHWPVDPDYFWRKYELAEETP